MNLLQILKRNLVIFSYALLTWLGLIVLEVVLDFDGMFAGLIYWISLIILFLAVWYANVAAVRNINNEIRRFFASLLLTTLITTIFLVAGIVIGAYFKHVITH
jgi:hypothetical protein